MEIALQNEVVPEVSSMNFEETDANEDKLGEYSILSTELLST
jgi:hypothetical protein